MRADWESWTSLPELSSHCWFLSVDRTHATNPKPCSAPTPTKILGLDRVEEFSPRVMAKPGLSPDIMSFFIFPSGLRSSHLVGFLRLSHKTHLHWLPLRVFFKKGKLQYWCPGYILWISLFAVVFILKVKTQKKPEKMDDKTKHKLQSSILSTREKKNPKHFFLTTILVLVLPLAVHSKQKFRVSTLFNPALSQR